MTVFREDTAVVEKKIYFHNNCRCSSAYLDVTLPTVLGSWFQVPSTRTCTYRESIPADSHAGVSSVTSTVNLKNSNCKESQWSSVSSQIAAPKFVSMFAVQNNCLLWRDKFILYYVTAAAEVIINQGSNKKLKWVIQSGLLIMLEVKERYLARFTLLVECSCIVIVNMDQIKRRQQNLLQCGNVLFLDSLMNYQKRFVTFV